MSKHIIMEQIKSTFTGDQVSPEIFQAYIEYEAGELREPYMAKILIVIRDKANVGNDVGTHLLVTEDLLPIAEIDTALEKNFETVYLYV